MTGKPRHERERRAKGKKKKRENIKSNEVRKRESQIKRGFNSARARFVNYLILK